MAKMKEFIRELMYEELTGSEARVILFLLGRLSFKKNKFRRVKKTDLAVDLGMKVSTVSEAMEGLKRKKIIISENQTIQDNGKKNRFILNAEYSEDEDDFDEDEEEEMN